MDAAAQLLKLGPKLQQFTEHGHLHTQRKSSHMQLTYWKKYKTNHPHTHTHTHTHYLCLSEDVRAQLVAILQDVLGLFRWDVYLQGGGHRGVDETVNDGGDLLLDGGLIAVGMAEVLHTGQEGTDEK